MNRCGYSIMGMSFYEASVRWVDAGVVCSAAIINLVLGYTSFIDQEWLSLFFRVILYFIDFSIFAAVVVATQGKGGIAIFYLFRAAFLIAAPECSLATALLPALLAFGALRTCSLLLQKRFALPNGANPRSKQQRQEERKKQQQLNMWFLAALGVVLLAVTAAVTWQINGGITGLLLTVAVCCLVCQCRQISLSPGYAGRMIGNTLHLNFYFLLLACVGVAVATDVPLKDYLTPTFFYFIALLLYARLFVALNSSKFHSMDADLLYAASPFSQVPRSSPLKGQEEQLRVARVVDKASRQLGLLIYIIGMILSSLSGSPIWIGIGAIVANVYRLESSENRVKAWLEGKLGVRPRLLLLLPLLVFISRFYNQDYSQRELLQSRVSFCGPALNIQTALSAVLALVAMASQAIGSRRQRNWAQKGVAIAFPWLLLWCCMWLECQQLSSALVVVYSLALCLSVVRDERLAVLKGAKFQ